MESFFDFVIFSIFKLTPWMHPSKKTLVLPDIPVRQFENIKI